MQNRYSCHTNFAMFSIKKNTKNSCKKSMFHLETCTCMIDNTYYYWVNAKFFFRWLLNAKLVCHICLKESSPDVFSIPTLQYYLAGHEHWHDDLNKYYIFSIRKVTKHNHRMMSEDINMAQELELFLPSLLLNIIRST